MEKVKLKYLFKKEFVFTFKDKCKKENKKQTDFIKECMIDFISKKN